MDVNLTYLLLSSADKIPTQTNDEHEECPSNRSKQYRSEHCTIWVKNSGYLTPSCCFSLNKTKEDFPFKTNGRISLEI